jgi:hypothetical protein
VKIKSGLNVLARSFEIFVLDAARSLERGNKHPPNVASQNPTDAAWLRNRRVASVKYEKIKIT